MNLENKFFSISGHLLHFNSNNTEINKALHVAVSDVMNFAMLVDFLFDCFKVRERDFNYGEFLNSFRLYYLFNRTFSTKRFFWVKFITLFFFTFWWIFLLQILFISSDICGAFQKICFTLLNLLHLLFSSHRLIFSIILLPFF